MSFTGKLQRIRRTVKEYFAGGEEAHCWKRMLKTVKPEAGAFWRFTHYTDLLVSELRYPGLDAMDYFLYRFFELPHSKRKTYITEGGLKRMVRHFNGDPGSAEWKALDAKTDFNRNYADLLGRKWIGSDCSEEEFRAFCLGKKRIVKPVNDGQGKGIFVASPGGEEECHALYQKLAGGSFIIEELLMQHEKLKALNPSSVNTLRIYTVLDREGKSVHVTGAVLRIGRSGQAVDNWHAGGMAAEIDTKRGVVSSPALDGTGSEYTKHPDTGEAILGLEIPGWEEALRVVSEAHKRAGKLRYIGWDVVVCSDGSVALLEANPYGGVHLQQQPCRKGKKEVYRALWD